MTALMQFLTRLDRSVFHAINSLAGKSAILNWLARLGADDHIIPIVLTLLVLFMVFIAKNAGQREAAFRCLICSLVAVVISMVILFALNSAFFRPRPFTGQVNFIFYHNTDSAFPSNAATLAFVLAFSVLFYNRKLGVVMVALGTYLGLARVMVGVHYPLDIVGGILLGLAAACISRSLEPVYRPVARLLTSTLYRLLGSWAPTSLHVRGARGK